jgi:hypothetical protein
MILNGFLARLRGFNPFLGDIGPFLRPDLGGKLGDGYQLQIYINQAFLRPWREGGLEQVYAAELLSQNHCHAGKLLRSAPLQAIFGSFVHPNWVLSVLMGS